MGFGMSNISAQQLISSQYIITTLNMILVHVCLICYRGSPKWNFWFIALNLHSNHTSLLMSVITDYHMILGLTEIKN